MSKREKVAKKKNTGIGKFLLGAAVGTGLGILFAPKAGSETRRDLRNKINELTKKVKELKIAKEKAKDLKQRCEELVQLAVDKGTPVLEKAADEVREKTIDAIKEILEKLENTDKKAKIK